VLENYSNYRWKNDLKNDLNIMKIYTIGKTASRTDINGKKSLRRPRHSMNEVVEPEEEEEEEEEEEVDLTR
jgi:hypothetical protein